MVSKPLSGTTYGSQMLFELSLAKLQAPSTDRYPVLQWEITKPNVIDPIW